MVAELKDKLEVTGMVAPLRSFGVQPFNFGTRHASFALFLNSSRISWILLHRHIRIDASFVNYYQCIVLKKQTISYGKLIVSFSQEIILVMDQHI